MLRIKEKKEKIESKKIAVIQSNYVPWIGYFALINSVDLFIVYECVQYTKNDWRNRNQIQANDGRRTWLSIPIRQVSSIQSFTDTIVDKNEWAAIHVKTLQHHFAKTKGWLHLHDEIQEMYDKASKLKYLFEINRLFFEWVISKLGITTPVIYLNSYPKFKDPTDRLISILKEFNATEYLSGPTAENYINPNKFTDSKIQLEYANYNELIKRNIIGTQPVKTTSVLQFLLEDKHEFRSN